MANTGENEQALRKIIDFIRLMSIVTMLLHFYYFCHQQLKSWGFTVSLTDRIVYNISNTGLLVGIYRSKLVVFGLLILSLIGAKGKKDETINVKTSLLVIAIGSIIFFLSHLIFRLPISELAVILYIAITGLGFLLILTGG